MIDDRDDPVLDACLEEILAGQSPPDLTERIVHAWRETSQGNGVYLPSKEPPVQSPTPPPVAPPTVTPASQHRATDRKRGGNRLPVAAGTIAGILLVGLLLTAALVRWNNRDRFNPDKQARQPNTPKQAPTTPSPREKKKQPRDKTPPAPQVVDNDPKPVTPPIVPDKPKQQPQPPEPVRPKPSRLTDAEVIALIDDQLEETQSEYDVAPAQAATDEEWCRRVFLRLAGRIPTVQELQQFLQSDAEQKRELLVDDLLAGSEYSQHWTDAWTNTLIGRSGGTRPGDLANRQGLEQYIHTALIENRPYDQMAYELISATGSSAPSSDDFNGAVNFLLAGMDEKTTIATDRTARVFLGVELQCTQCHNHPFNEWKQHKYWELNSFFRQMHVRRDRKKGIVRLVNRSFLGESGDLKEAGVFYEEPNRVLKVAYPTLPDGKRIDSSGYVDQVNRREELARWISGSEDLSRSVVNRIWSQFFGYGFTRPVDDMGPHNSPSHPELLKQLAGQFEAHDYDLRRLTRWIVLSDAFARSSRQPEGELVDNPEAGGIPLFSRYYTRQLSPEAVYQSLLVAANVEGDHSQQKLARAQWMGQFTRDMQTDDGAEENTFDGTINQSLAMMNGPLMQRAVSGQPGSLLERVANSKLTSREKIEQLFLASVSRRPTALEHRQLGRLFASRKNDPRAALQDVWWALLNSNEFILDH